jgi:hypothetical protein
MALQSDQVYIEFLFDNQQVYNSVIIGEIFGQNMCNFCWKFTTLTCIWSKAVDVKICELKK